LGSGCSTPVRHGALSFWDKVILTHPSFHIPSEGICEKTKTNLRVV
jgi:hypothetical protein